MEALRFSIGGVIGWASAQISFIALCCMASRHPEHGLHHANPDEAVLTIFWQIWVVFRCPACDGTGLQRLNSQRSRAAKSFLPA